MYLIETIGTTLIPSIFVRVSPLYLLNETKITAGKKVYLGFSLNNISVIVPIVPLTRPAETHIFAVSITRAFLNNNSSALSPFAVLESALKASDLPV